MAASTLIEPAGAHTASGSHHQSRAVETPAPHEAGEGFRLAAATRESVVAGGRCPRSARVRSYRIVAIPVDITLNRYLDHDPHGRMFVLEEDLARVRGEEGQNRAARDGRGEPAVSAGLQGDAIQPLTLRVSQGECLRVRLRNALPAREPASFHLHGSSLRVVGGGAALATNPAATVRPGRQVTYEWMVRDTEPEGTHEFHSHGQVRAQSGHGLFGAVIVEPRGSSWLNPADGKPVRTGWAAVVRPPVGSAFREFALYYHEVGAENEQVLDRSGQFVPLVDPMTHAYRPDARALNYRSEPFMNRLELQLKTFGRIDESLEYSSYAFGDPATPLLRSYLGDPVKQRVIHAGSEVFHVHHVHGGGIRWHRQSGVEDSAFATGLDKHPPLRPTASDRTDAQSIGPSETYDIADECGSGGCQQSVGDFMYHCHVAHHYFAGMWGIWRVYNTLQDGHASTDSLPPLLELVDRSRRVEPGVPSSELIGHTVNSYGTTSPISADGLGAWVERQLPPSGVPKGYDASVLDWRRVGDSYLGEVETERTWPGYRSPTPGARPQFLFDPLTGKLAYPFLHPHLGARPPFAPDHGPAPFLDPVRSGPDPPPPGENGPASTCPAGTRARPLAINAISTSIPLNAKNNLVDSSGQLFVRRDQEDAVLADSRLRVPLAIRANAGEDCVDVLLRSELTDNPDDAFSKVSAHIHFVQFDIQASDGVDTGFNYEQTIRPFRAEGDTLTSPAAAESTELRLSSADRFQAGATIGIGMDRDKEFEARRISGIDGNVVHLESALSHPHREGEVVSTEFVRYRWYPDTQFGAAFFHDHVNVISSSRHGLFGALISEPPGSSYRDPHNGGEVLSGALADIQTDAQTSPDVSGSFRELAMLIQDDNPITRVGRSSGSSFNLRVEPLEGRDPEPSRLFSSSDGRGDPETPLLEAYLGDPLVVRDLVGSSNDVHTWHLDGHWFRREPYSLTSAPTSTIDIGVSERFDLAIPRAGGPQAMPGDYLYQNGRSFKLREGSWGIVRVHDANEGGLRKLPGHDVVPAAAPAACPPDAPRRSYSIAAIEVALPMLGGAKGKVYVLEDDRAATLSGKRAPEPLVLHVGVGDCVVASLRNDTSAGAVSLHADMLAFDPKSSGGIAAGNDPPQVVGPGEVRTFTYYAHPEVGETTALLRDGGDPLANSGRGLYGAIVVGPRGASYRDPFTGDDLSSKASWRVDVRPPTGRPYRDFSLFFQDEDAGIGTHRMPYTRDVDGVVGLNYRVQPLPRGRRTSIDTDRAFRSAARAGPSTPVMHAYTGEAVRIHVLAPWSEQEQVFSLEGHAWPREPGRPGTDLVSSVAFGGLDALSLELTSAGGLARLPGDYLYGDHREPYREAGLWGIFRIRPSCKPRGTGLRPLAGACRSRA